MIKYIYHHRRFGIALCCIFFIVLNIFICRLNDYVKLKQSCYFKFQKKQLEVQASQLSKKIKTPTELAMLRQKNTGYERKLYGGSGAIKSRHEDVSTLLAAQPLKIIQLESKMQDGLLNYDVKVHGSFCEFLVLLKRVTEWLPMVYFSELNITSAKEEDGVLVQASLRGISRKRKQSDD